MEHSDPVSPSSLNRSVDRDLETICLKCLEKEPIRRYQTALALAQELRRYLSGEPILARPLRRLGRLIRWSRRNPAVAMMTGCTAAALLLGTTISLYWASVAESRAVDATRAEMLASAAATEASEQRDQAQRQLYQSLMNEARSLRQTKLQGWRELALDSLDRAGKLTDAGGDVAGLRGELLTILSQMDCVQLPILDNHSHSTVRSLAFSNEGDRLVNHGYDGRLIYWNVNEDGIRFDSEIWESAPKR